MFIYITCFYIISCEVTDAVANHVNTNGIVTVLMNTIENANAGWDLGKDDGLYDRVLKAATQLAAAVGEFEQKCGETCTAEHIREISDGGGAQQGLPGTPMNKQNEYRKLVRLCGPYHGII